MLTDYIDAVMRHATYEMIEDGTYYSHIATANLTDLWANEQTLEACRDELKERGRGLAHFRPRTAPPDSHYSWHRQRRTLWA